MLRAVETELEGCRNPTFGYLVELGATGKSFGFCMYIEFPVGWTVDMQDKPGALC